MIDCGIIGATGYAGAELLRLLSSHPEVAGLSLSSVSFEGDAMERVYPNFIASLRKPGVSGRLVNQDSIVEASDVVFSCLPHGLAEKAAAECLAAGKVFIDISADFRFGDDEETFKTWYGKSWTNKAVHAVSVYGLPELNRALIAKAKVIGNPGCYPTSAILGLMPALRLGLAETDRIIIDAASGVTGAGREPSKTTHFPECADGYTPYKIGEHRHTPEIIRTLSGIAGKDVNAIFTPHLAPMNRGIVSTIYFGLARAATLSELHEAYLHFYSDEAFVRVLPEGMVSSNRYVKYSNFCDISIHMAQDGKTAIVVSSIDNMVKGAAGQAVQNMNIALGFDEKSGLTMIPPAF